LNTNIKKILAWIFLHCQPFIFSLDLRARGLYCFSAFPTKLEIKVIDGENSVIGKIIDIKPFHFQIEVESGEIVSYPNNLILQKPILQLHDDEPEGELRSKS
jgi:hypothetical protein